MERRRKDRMRCVRILPLYLLALVNFSRPIGLTLASLIGLNNFLPGIDGRNIPTLWFVSQLIVYYALYPGLRALRNRWLQAAVCAVIECLFYAGYVRFGWDHRLWWYFPLYASGILLADWDERRILSVSVVLAGAFAILTLATNVLDLPLAFAASGCGFVLAVSKLVAMLPGAAFVLGPVAYASMNAYLFHKKEYHRLLLAFDALFGRDARSGPSFLLWIYLVCVPAAFAIGWAVQRLYDRLVATRLR